MEGKEKDSIRIDSSSSTTECADDISSLRQKRLLSFLFSKNVPPVPSEDEVESYPMFSISRILKFALFWEVAPLLKVGYKRTIQDTDIWKLPDHRTVEHHFIKFKKEFDNRIARWRKSHPDKDPNNWPTLVLIISIFAPFKWRAIASISFGFINEICSISVSVVIKKLVNFVEARTDDPSIPVGPGVGYALSIFFMNMFLSFGFNHMFAKSMKVGIDAKSVLIAKCLEKATVLTAKGRARYSPNKVTSFVGNDLSRFEYAFTFGCILIPMVCAMLATIGLLIWNIGVAALAGIAIVTCTCMVQSYGSRSLYKLRSYANVYTDFRVGYIREMLNNFKIIKFYNWEKPQFDRIKQVRDEEMKLMLKMKFIRSGIAASALGMPLVGTMVSFIILYKTRGITDVAAIFSSLSLFNVLADQVTFLPQVIFSSTDAYSALTRVNGLYQCEEETNSLSNERLNVIDESTAIEIRNGTFAWQRAQEDVGSAEEDLRQLAQQNEIYELQKQFSQQTNHSIDKESLFQKTFSGLQNVNLKIQKGEFIIITGLVGSGKTSLLNAIAGIMTKASGDLITNGSLLFCGQPWVQNATVKENIVFGSEFNQEKYAEVVTSCALLDDFKIFEFGDLTEVGERGVQLSGGQKARINLARAVYANKDIILLDDVLSAVDSKVGEHIMKKCIMGSLAGSTRLLATHQLSLIGAADRVVFLNKDGTLDIGTVDELKSRNDDFLSLLSFGTQIQEDEDHPKIADLKEEVTEVEKYSKKAAVSQEQKAVNHLSWAVYKTFLFGGTKWTRFLPPISLVNSLVVYVFTYQFSTVWLSFWAEDKFGSMSSGSYIGLYVFFNLVCVVGALLSMLSLSWLLNNASKHLVITAIYRVLCAPTSFMDTTPLGRVLNRFTKDSDVLDNEIYENLLLLVSQTAQLIGTIIMCVIYLPWIAISVPFALFGCFIISDYCQSTARELKRIEAVRRSFIFNNFNETLTGLSTIKAYQAEDRFIARSNEYMNRTNAAQYIGVTSQRCMSLHLTVIAALFGFLISILATLDVFGLSAATVGLLLSTLMSFSMRITQIFRSLLLVENDMNSAERLYQYSEHLIQEAPFKISETAPRPDWPVKPSISFDHVSMAYRPNLPLVLKDVSFDVKPKEKIGICGRTGAGKSSIMSALFRLTELSAGRIIIDGIEIGKIGLEDLRSRLTIIPQESVMFKGTIRDNIDPFGQHSDEKLWQVLYKSGLVNDEDKRGSQKFHLDALVDDDGANLSLGEKQLVALARALVRESNILILDEATSSVDYETDSKIQTTIANEFNHCTILCIAHRLKTILQYDRILVLERGGVKEFDTPFNLFSKKDSIFREMCEKSNITESDFGIP